MKTGVSSWHSIWNDCILLLHCFSRFDTNQLCTKHSAVYFYLPLPSKHTATNHFIHMKNVYVENNLLWIEFSTNQIQPYSRKFWHLKIFSPVFLHFLSNQTELRKTISDHLNGVFNKGSVIAKAIMLNATATYNFEYIWYNSWKKYFTLAKPKLLWQ